MFCCTLLYVHSCLAIILMGKRELDALLSLSSWCLLIVVWLFLMVPWVCLQFVIVVFPDHTIPDYLTVSILRPPTPTFFMMCPGFFFFTRFFRCCFAFRGDSVYYQLLVLFISLLRRRMLVARKIDSENT